MRIILTVIYFTQLYWCTSKYHRAKLWLACSVNSAAKATDKLTLRCLLHQLIKSLTWWPSLLAAHEYTAEKSWTGRQPSLTRPYGHGLWWRLGRCFFQRPIVWSQKTGGLEGGIICTPEHNLSFKTHTHTLKKTLPLTHRHKNHITSVITVPPII